MRPRRQGELGFLRRLSRVLGAGVQRQRRADRRRRATASGCAALPGCRPSIAAPRPTSISSSTAGPVRDKLLLGAVRGAYADVMPSDRHPVLALPIDLDPRAGRRQRPSGQDRGALPRSGPRALPRRRARSRRRSRAPGFRAATTGGARTLGSLRPDGAAAAHVRPRRGARAIFRHARRLRGLAGAARLPTRTPMARICGAAGDAFGDLALPSADARAERLRARPRPRTRRSARRARRSTAPTSSRRRRTASSSSTSTPRTSASSTSA